MKAYHNTLRRVFRKYNDIHPWQTHLSALDNLADLLGVFHHLLGRMQSGHGVLEDGAADLVFRGGGTKMVDWK